MGCSKNAPECPSAPVNYATNGGPYQHFQFRVHHGDDLVGYYTAGPDDCAALCWSWSEQGCVAAAYNRADGGCNMKVSVEAPCGVPDTDWDMIVLTGPRVRHH